MAANQAFKATLYGSGSTPGIGAASAVTTCPAMAWANMLAHSHLFSGHATMCRPTSLRYAAFALAIAAALAGASIRGSSPANAQQTPRDKNSIDCATVTEPGWRAVCDKFGTSDEARRRSATELERSLQDRARTGVSCMEAVENRIDVANKAGPLTALQISMFRAEIERCEGR